MCSIAGPGRDHLHDLVLAAFTQAWRARRLDVADHLLRALEALTAEDDHAAHRDRAYRLLAQGQPS